MPLSRRVRAFVKLGELMTALHVLPDARRAAQLPLAKRLAVAPPRWALDPAPPGVTHHDDVLPSGARLRLYRPQGDAVLPVLLYLHGGGWTVGGLVGTEHICLRLAADAGCAVLAVEYRLAPEHPYPAGLQDCENALAWARENGTGLLLGHHPRRHRGRQCRWQPGGRARPAGVHGRPPAPGPAPDLPGVGRDPQRPVRADLQRTGAVGVRDRRLLGDLQRRPPLGRHRDLSCPGS